METYGATLATVALNLVLIFILKVVALTLGYFTIRLGKQLISEGAKGEFKFGAGLPGVKADLVSASPGLLFVLLGSFLIAYGVFVDKVVEVRASPVTSPIETQQHLPVPPDSLYE